MTILLTESMIAKAALLVFRDNQSSYFLYAQKGRSYFVFPGGKRKMNETLQRKLQEELDLASYLYRRPMGAI